MSNSNLSSPVITPAQLAVVNTPFVIARYAALNKLRQETEQKKRQLESDRITRENSIAKELQFDKIQPKIEAEAKDSNLVAEWHCKKHYDLEDAEEIRIMADEIREMMETGWGAQFRNEYMFERINEEREKLRRDVKYVKLEDEISNAKKSLDSELNQFANNANQKLHEFSGKLQKLKGYDFVLYHDGNAAPFFYATNTIDVSTHITSLLNGEAIDTIPPVREVICKVVFIDLEKIKNAIPMTEDDVERMTKEIWRKTTWLGRSSLVEYIEYSKLVISRLENGIGGNARIPIGDELRIKREAVSKMERELESLDKAVNDRINSFKPQLVQQARNYVEQTHTEKGYDYVLPVSEVVYADEKFNITEDVVAMLNHKSSTSSTYTGVAASKIAFLSFADIQQKCTLTTNGHALSREELMPKIKTILRDLQKSKGFDFVINDQLFWCANPKFNITNDVLAVLNSGKV